jgi:hypothetical protein
MSNKVVYVLLSIHEISAGRQGRMQYQGTTPVITVRNWTKAFLSKPQPSAEHALVAISVDESLLQKNGDDLIVRWGNNPNPQQEDFQVFEFRPARLFLDGEAPAAAPRPVVTP